MRLQSCILKDSKIEEITPIFQIEDANSASHAPVVHIEDIHVGALSIGSHQFSQGDPGLWGRSGLSHY